jgi:hypothetical protein
MREGETSPANTGTVAGVWARAAADAASLHFQRRKIMQKQTESQSLATLRGLIENHQFDGAARFVADSKIRVDIRIELWDGHNVAYEFGNVRSTEKLVHLFALLMYPESMPHNEQREE